METQREQGSKIIFDKVKSPDCPHGPTILFEKIVKGIPRQFYACSAYRDRKYCDFFHWKDDKVTNGKLIKWKVTNKDLIRNKDHAKLYSKLISLEHSNDGNINFCQNCGTLSSESQPCEGHRITCLTKEDLQNPSKILAPLSNNKKEAQYFFSKSSASFLTDTLVGDGCHHILFIGTPTIFEQVNKNSPEIRTLFLDIDFRYLSFYGPMQFCWYNFLNGHFFLGESSRSLYEEFIRESGGKLTVVLDPPFGAKTELIGQGFKNIASDLRRLCEMKSDCYPKMFWIFPYFMETKVKETGLSLKMSDYKVCYDNHKQFGGGEGTGGRKQGSPVRIFTNVDLKSLMLPASEGYKFCSQCSIWVSQENKHCDSCRGCTSKDGRTYVHCGLCKRCVKPTYSHCDTCERCLLPSHDCLNVAGVHGQVGGRQRKRQKQRESQSADGRKTNKKRKRRK